jgi:hypothetical protein
VGILIGNDSNGKVGAAALIGKSMIEFQKYIQSRVRYRIRTVPYPRLKASWQPVTVIDMLPVIEIKADFSGYDIFMGADASLIAEHILCRRDMRQSR